jgi:hypothetical protein
MEKRKHDYIPRGAWEFKEFMAALVSHVRAKAPQWGHIPAPAVAGLESSFVRFNKAYDDAAVARSPVLNAARRQTQAEAAKTARVFVNQYLRHPPVTDIDRVEMGVRNPDTVRTVHAQVHEEAEFEIRLRNIRELLIDFWVKGAAGKAKPNSHYGAVIVYAVLDTPPKNIGELTRHVTAGKTPYALRFDERERGKTVYTAVAWQNERRALGSWSEIKSGVVP